MADKYDNHTFETATDLGTDLTINTESGTVGDATLGTEGEQDYYSFTLNKAAYVTLTTSGTAGGDTIMYLYDEDGEQIASDDNGGEDSYSKISNALLQSGTYYVMVKADEGTTIDEYSLAANVVMSIVTTADDVVDDTDGVTSLREAVSYTELIDDEHPVTFAGDFEIKLDKTLDISANTTIDGEDNAVTITGPAGARMFESNYELTLRNLTIEAGSTEGETTVINAQSGAKVNGLTLANTAKLRVYEGGEANSTVMSGGKLYIYDGGTADTTTLSAGNIYVSGGSADNTTIEDGSLLVYEDGEVNSTVMSGGAMTVSGTANDTTVYGGALEVVGSANFTSVYGGTMNVAGEASDTIVSSGAMTVSGAAYDTYVTSGILDVYGAASGITADADATVAILANGTAEDITVNWHGKLHVSDGGVAARPRPSPPAPSAIWNSPAAGRRPPTREPWRKTSPSAMAARYTYSTAAKRTAPPSTKTANSTSMRAARRTAPPSAAGMSKSTAPRTTPTSAVSQMSTTRCTAACTSAAPRTTPTSANTAISKSLPAPKQTTPPSVTAS